MTAVDYDAFARRLTAAGAISDPWIDGAPRFEPRPLLLPRDTSRALASAAEGIAATLDEVNRIVAAEPSLLDGFFGLTDTQKLMWCASAPLWHGLARADVFIREDGTPVVCELNCDTPSGLAEAIHLGAVAGTDAPAGFADPNAELGDRVGALVASFAARSRGPTRATVGIVYPTEHTEDLALIALYRSWCEARGFDVVLGSPFNLGPLPAGGVALFGRRCEVVWRHYKTDWWGERLPLRDDEAPYPDPDPLEAPLAALLRAELDGAVAVLNPFGAVLPQNKRAFAFCWEALERFSAEAQAFIRASVPYTVRLEAADHRALAREREDWVLKSDYGCEGEEVLVGRETPADVWAATLEHALPHRWVAQRHFAGQRDAAGRLANHGVFLVAGRAAGIYTRLSVGATDVRAASVATLVET